MKSSRATGSTGEVGSGGELHQKSEKTGDRLTTNQGITISDNQNSLRVGSRGPALLEDFMLREKITHFDHERIPERIVHARGSGAHGYFELTKSLRHLTKAGFLQNTAKQTEVFVRFSTVAGGAGSVDLPRDVRGFAVKFYTDEGNFDLVGNNIPVFFIQDAVKFPDLVHSVKMEPDRGFPQNASAHDTFWDFVSLMPESMHMLMWVMSDRAIPRSLRMIEGFGVNTFRFVNAEGDSNFVKFHWRPVLGAASVLWDEAVKINGADQDFHRRDLWKAIDSGNFPEFEFGVQIIDEATAAGLDFDILDATKLIPEEVVPLQIVGKMVLNRNPDNFFAETEQVAFHPANIVPGIEFSDDPLLQGRLFSYLDTQLSRLGGANFHEIPVNRPRCPMRNFQRDGMRRIDVPKGRVAYEPNSLDPDSPRESGTGFATHPEGDFGPRKIRERSETFKDHYSQARMFFNSMSEPEQRHIVSAFAFELGKVETPAIRKRMLGHLAIIDKALCGGVSKALGTTEIDPIKPALEPRDLAPSPALSIIKKAPATLRGRKIGVLLSNGIDGSLVKQFRKAIEAEGAEMAVVCPKIGGVLLADKAKLPADHALSGAPSVIFDAVAVFTSDDGARELAEEASAIDWVRDAFGHLKVIGFNGPSAELLNKAGLSGMFDEGIVKLDDKKADFLTFINAAKQQRIWEREPKIRSPG
ncbi:catalase [Nordella sp. HKS 07]|uniref:catalase n=1 Tax=Nordella sp. HKS 07 TaxID=2712222 RepID=UPI0013E1F536|nr:catalase [Nordella sp. HKS 07]QIG47031.1 catalase [Nordella sp. HKS 07]